MRRYLAMQAMESGKTLHHNFLSRGNGMPYGHGMLLNTDTSSSKVGELCLNTWAWRFSANFASHSPLCLPLAHHWFVEARWSKLDGFGHLLFSREVLRDLLHQQ